MCFIEWCNQNNGFISAILSIIGLLLSIIAIVISIHTARLPYKKKLLLGSSLLLGVSRIPLRGTETSLVGMSSTATNVGNRTISLTYLGFAIKKDGKLNKMYTDDRPFDSTATLDQTEMHNFQYSKAEIIKD